MRLDKYTNSGTTTVVGIIRQSVTGMIIYTLLLGFFAPFLVVPAGAQEPDKAAERKKWLTEAIEVVRKLNVDRPEQLATYKIEDSGSDYVADEIFQGSIYSDTSAYTALASYFDSYFQAPDTTPPPAEDPIRDQDFYGHPATYFKHHINWVTNKDYDKKVDWAALVSDFDTWKSNEKQIWELYDELRAISREIAELRKSLGDAPNNEERQRIEAKIAELEKKQESPRNKIRELVKFRGRYGFVLDTEPQGIARTIVLTPQTAVDNGLHRFPYPFGKRFEVNTDGEPTGRAVDAVGDGAERLLFVIGRGLPTNYSEPISVTSDDQSVSYTVLGLERAPQDQGRKEFFAEGRKRLEAGLDPATKAVVDKLDAVLLRATLTNGVLPGLKDFKLNGFEGFWDLRFGDDIAEIAFARSFQSETSDPAEVNIERVELTEHVFLPEQVWIEVRTLAAFPVSELRLRVQVGEKKVLWDTSNNPNSAPDPLMPGTESIVAKLVAFEPVGRSIEVRPRPESPARLMRQAMAIYRTRPIEFYKVGETQPPIEPGVFRLAVNHRDSITAKLENPLWFRGRPPLGKAVAYNDPSEVGLTWRHALTKAAKIAGYEVASWDRLEGKKAAEIGNYVVVNGLLPSREGVGVIGVWRELAKSLHSTNPKFARRNAIKEKVTVTLADHAALLLFKDAFIKQQEQFLANFEKVVPKERRWEAAAWLATIKSTASDESDAWIYKNNQGVVSSVSSPWKYIRVSGPKGGEVPFSFALSDSYLEATFGKTPEARTRAFIWSTDAAQAALVKYKEAIQYSIQKVRDTPDNDVDKLLELIGLGYEAILPEITPRIMTLRDVGTSGYQRWRGDLNPRMALARLQIPAEARRAQADLARQDTRFLIAMATAVAAPIVMSFTTAGTLAAVVIEELIFNVGISLIETALFEIPDAVRQRQEIQFALGASMIMGSERLRIADVNKTEWFEIGLQILINYVQGKLPADWLMAFRETAAGLRKAAVSTVKRAVSWVRTGLVLRKIGRGGLGALDKMPIEDVVSFFDFVTEAKAIQKKDPAMMTSQHRRAIDAADRLHAEAVAKGKAAAPTAKLPPPEPVVTAKSGTEAVPPKEKAVEYADTEQLETSVKYGKPGQVEPLPPPVKPSQPAGAKARKFPNAPPEKTPWPTGKYDADGNEIVLNLGELLGEGSYAAVYRLWDKNGRPTGKVVKVYELETGDLTGTGATVVNNTRHGAELLADGSKSPPILQLANEAYVPDAKLPYLIQAERTSEMVVFDYKPTVKIKNPNKPGEFIDTYPLSRKSLGDFARDEGLQRAVVELFYNLVQKGLVWEDCHLGNMFFVKDTTGKWVAGIFDQDRIIKFTERNGPMGTLFGIVETHPFTLGKNPRLRIRSLGRASKAKSLTEAYDIVGRYGENGIFYPSPEFFMEKMFEYKDWLVFNPETGRYEQSFLHPNIVMERFPRLYEGVRHPPDLMGPNFKGPIQQR